MVTLELSLGVLLRLKPVTISATPVSNIVKNNNENELKFPRLLLWTTKVMQVGFGGRTEIIDGTKVERRVRGINV